MKSFFAVLFVVFITYNGFSQNVIKFLGIPIEGSKKEMISKLKEKGYEYNSTNDVLLGEFNGTDVFLSVQPVNNRVWRIGIVDANDTDEANIKVRFNRLFDQLSNNGKYVLKDGRALTESDDISYEMVVHKKRYEAIFDHKDKTINGIVWYMIGNEYGKYRILMFYENLDNAANGDDL